MVAAKSIAREKELWFLLTGVLVYFYRPLFLNETLFYRDLLYVFFFQKLHLLEFLKAGELPLWNPYLGQPLLGDSYTTLYPSLVLYFIFSPVTAMNLDVILHAALSAVAMYWLARELNLRPLSSLVAGVIFVFCGYSLSCVNNLRLFIALPYVPLVILFWHRFLLNRNVKWFVVTVICGFLQIYTGGVEVWAATVATALGWGLFYPYPEYTAFRKLCLWMLLTISMVGISSIQVFPALERISQSSRATGIDFEVLTRWSMHPKRLPELVFPGFLGTADAMGPLNYWGRKIERIYPPFILSMYWGVPCLVFAAIGSFLAWKEGGLPVQVRRFLLLLFVTSAVVSFGRNLPLSQAFYEMFPVKIFRYPVKALMAGILPIAILAACTIDRHFCASRPSKRSAGGFWLVFILLLPVSILYRASADFASAFEMFFFQGTGEPLQRQGLNYSIGYATGISLLAALLYQYRRISPNRWQSWLIAGVIAVDMLVSGFPLNPYAPAELLTKEPDVVPLIRHEIGDGKFYRGPIPRNIRLTAPSSDMVWGERWDLEVLRYHLASVYRIPVIYHQGIDDMTPVEVQKLRTEVNSLPWPRRLPLLSAANVTLIMTEDDVAIPGMQKIATIHNQSNFPFYLYKNLTSPGDAYFAENASPAASVADALSRMEQETFDPRKNAIIQGGTVTASGSCSPAAIRRVKSSATTSAYQVDNSCKGYFVFTQPIYPGWKHYVDGKLAEVLPANGVFSAVYLEPGRHEVIRCYRPASWIWGGSVSLLFCILLFAVYRRGLRAKA